MLRANILNRAVRVVRFSLDESQTKIPTFNLRIPARDVAGLGSLYFVDIEVYDNNRLIVSGIIRTPLPVPELSEEVSNPVYVNLKCDNQLGRLAAEEGALFHFQDVLVSDAITQLLATTSQSIWALNDITTLNDVPVTIDVRGKQTIWSQIQDVIQESGEPTYVRYGGLVAGVHQLDMGFFGARPNANRVLQHSNVLEPATFRSQTTEPILVIRPLSGESSDTPVNLDDALNIDPTLSNPAQNYQIVAGAGLIQNNTITSGVRLTKAYNAHKTENNEPPTQAELDQAAISMYRQAAREMEQSIPYLTLDVKCSLEFKPLLHDEMWVELQVYEREVDLYTNQTQLVRTVDLRQWLRIIEVKYEHRERPAVVNEFTQQVIPTDVYVLTLSERADAETFDLNEIIYKQLQRNNRFDTIDASIGVFGRTRVPLQQDNVPADCAFNAVPLSGRQFSYAVPPPPPNASSVNAVIVGITGGYEFEVNQNASIGGTYIICVKPSIGNWTILDDATVTIEFVYT